MRPVIPLSAIRIFEAAARRRSFKVAAGDLGLSTSAISHAIRKMEEGLGVALKSTRLAERELASGRLFAPLTGRATDLRYVGHHLVFPATSRRRAPLRVFARWLAEELAIPLEPSLA